MTWLTWRQHRAQLITTAGLLIALGVLLLVSGREAAAYIAEHAPAGCPGPDLACGDLNAAIAERYNAIYTVYGWLPIGAPALIGAFWGAPLLGKEFERGTNKLAWTQAVSLRRWLGVKLALLAVAVMLGGLALSAMVSAWRPIFGDRGSFGNLGDFNMLGVAPAAWWLFAFMVGTAAGAVLRRTLPAMAVVVAVVSVVTFGLFSLSDHYAEPTWLVTADATATYTGDVRLVGKAWVDPTGTEMGSPPQGACPRGTDVGRANALQEAYERCLVDKGYRHVVYLHGPEQFWRFQWTDAAILFAGSLLLAGLTARRTTRRRA